MIRSIALLSALMLFQFPALAQQADSSFVLNESNPYVYLEFDHIGPRTPVITGEPQTGVWVRIVNNCRIPILVPTLGDRGKGGQVDVLDEVVQEGPHAVRLTATDSAGNEISSSKDAQKSKPPLGYADYASDTPGLTRVDSGQSLLFSVPLNHLAGGDWYMRVRFSLDIPGSKYGPYSYADSFTVHIPSEYTQQGPAKSR